LFQQKGITDMKTTTYTKQLTAIMPRNNGTAKGLSALQAALVRGKELVK
jgi:hypothetical protein